MDPARAEANISSHYDDRAIQLVGMDVATDALADNP